MLQDFDLLHLRDGYRDTRSRSRVTSGHAEPHSCHFASRGAGTDVRIVGNRVVGAAPHRAAGAVLMFRVLFMIVPWTRPCYAQPLAVGHGLSVRCAVPQQRDPPRRS